MEGCDLPWMPKKTKNRSKMGFEGSDPHDVMQYQKLGVLKTANTIM